MVEVDLRLFVTCRLCLEVQGHFQIDPKVQQQIKYCFDIDVEPFDGLPQLICKKCENILREHYAIKKNFTDKQKELKTKLQDNAKKSEKTSPQQDELKNGVNKTKVNRLPSSDSENSNFKDDYHQKNTKKKKKVKKKSIVNRLVSSSEDDLDTNDLSERRINSNATQHSPNEEVSWNACFNKYFVCRICSQGFQDKKYITEHIKKHSSLQMKYKNIFKMSCLVVMEKSDNKSNMCNSNASVVYSPDSIIQNTHNPFYYTKYHPKTYTFKYMSKNNSSSAESFEKVSTRKRRRLSSRSSNETVVINRHSEPEDTPHIAKEDMNPQPIVKDIMNPPPVIYSIELTDSSDNGSYESSEKNSNSNNKGKLDSKPMHNIIKNCLNKYNKQTDIREKNKAKENNQINAYFLQHKVLSIGRKIINNNGFNCTGLLRFLEYKDLSVIWKETSVLKANNDGKYVRIATRVRGNESSDQKNSGWKNFNAIKYEEENFKSVNILKKLKTFKNFKKKSEVKSVNNYEVNVNSVEKLPFISAVCSQADLEISKIESDSMLKKLLNKNPVLNPKKLPKKLNSNEIHSKTIKMISAPIVVPEIEVNQRAKNNEVDSNSMPIVTSTLAHLFDEEITDSPVDTPVVTRNNQSSTYPRIKVKPVSELMPEQPRDHANSNDTCGNGVQNASQISTIIWPTQNTSYDKPPPPYSSHTISPVISNSHNWVKQNKSLMEQQVWPLQNTTLSEQCNKNSVNNVFTSSKITDDVMIVKEYMLLDTVEFPNTKTTSPFQYLKDLLLLHNINLFDTDPPMPAGHVTLIKLKLVYQQEKCDPIALCSSLLCFRNIFSIQIKDLNHSIVHINNLSANWQWQLLQIYNDEIITKVLQTAAKVSQETYRYTQEFFALLKSIKSKNDAS